MPAGTAAPRQQSSSWGAATRLAALRGSRSWAAPAAQAAAAGESHTQVLQRSSARAWGCCSSCWRRRQAAATLCQSAPQHLPLRSPVAARCRRPQAASRSPAARGGNGSSRQPLQRGAWLGWRRWSTRTAGGPAWTIRLMLHMPPRHRQEWSRGQLCLKSRTVSVASASPCRAPSTHGWQLMIMCHASTLRICHLHLAQHGKYQLLVLVHGDRWI